MRPAGPGSLPSYWSGLAKAYDLAAQPLKPSPEDVGFVERSVHEWRAVHPDQRLKVLLLGVTPALATMAWPACSSLLAVDSSWPMIRSVWPGNLNRRRWAVCGDWRALPCPPHSMEIVIGDGSANCLSYPDGYRQLAAAVSGVLSRHGIFILRAYLRPPTHESAHDIIANLSAIPTFHHCKFRLLMALQRDVRSGIAVRDVYRFWVASNGSRTHLPAGPGWEPAAVDTIELYRETDTIHTFPSPAELRAVMGECLEEAECSVPTYPLGNRCPTLVWRQRRS